MTASRSFVQAFAQGGKEQLDLLGGKGAGLAEMTRLGLPVPPGFTITTEACRVYLATGLEPPELEEQVLAALHQLEADMGRTLGDRDNPLLVSVRSGAKFSMPGMMETVLDIGLNDDSVHGLAAHAADEHFAWDSYRRLIQMFGRTVLDIDSAVFEEALDNEKTDEGVASDSALDVAHLKDLVRSYQQIIEKSCGHSFPQDPREQLQMAIRAVFNSWNTDRARLYRRQERIPDDLGTAVNVQAMVFGNLEGGSGTGVAFTRDPADGSRGVYGDYLPDAQGEDVVAGIRNALPLSDLERLDKRSYDELGSVMNTLEHHYRDLCDIEFTIERGKLWMLQTRVGKRTAAAAFRVAAQLVDEQLIDLDEALRRVTGAQLATLMFPQFDPRAPRQRIAVGMNASPGASVGRAVFDSATAVAWAAEGKKVILVRRETNPDDLNGMIAAVGILTSHGGKTSHAAVVARGMGKTCVCGADELAVDSTERLMVNAQGREIREGDLMSIDGSTGEVFAGEVPVIPSAVVEYFESGLEAASATGDDQAVELLRSIDRVMRHADHVRRLRVRANADTPADAARARRMGAEGIGLARTEHMFLGDRKQYVERLILAADDGARRAALDELLPLQRGDFIQLLAEMDGLPVTIRLLDPPLHEFLPDLTELEVRVAVAAARGEANQADQVLLQAVRRMHEVNPMLGLRGVRLGLVVPGLFALQVRAIAEAACHRKRAGGDPRAEIMIPLVGAAEELELIAAEAQHVLREVGEQFGCELDLPIGTMIELPRAAVTAGRIARTARFFSFGTNDLTQTTWGFSRDDVEASFFSRYLAAGVFKASPFETLDAEGVGRLIEMAVDEGLSTRPDLQLGVCGEHGGDPESIHFFHRAGLDYVSSSPYRIPVARLEAGRAALAPAANPARTST